MKPWSSRPREIRNLFNPAFCGVVLARGIEGFTTTADRPMPFSLTLLILPLCLHKRSREILKAANKSYLAKTIENHPELLAGLAERTRGLMPYTLEAYGLLMAANTVQILENGTVVLKEGGIRKAIKGSDETKDCQTVAKSIGKKFAVMNDRATIYTSFGLRP